MPLPALQQVQDPAVDQNFRQVYLNWPADAPVTTTIPTGAGSGTTIMFQTAAMAALSPPLMWELRYSSAMSGWVPIGAAPLFAEVNPWTSLAAPDDPTTATTYSAIGVAGPVVQLPAPGWSDITTTFGAYHSAPPVPVGMSYSIGAAAAVDADAAAVDAQASAVARGFRQQRKQFSTAALLTAKYKTGSGTVTFRGPRSMMAAPVLL